MDLSNIGGSSLAFDYAIEPGLGLQTQGEFQEQWLYNTSIDGIHRVVRNREHARLLLASIDENLDWVTFSLQSSQWFSQAGYRRSGLMVVEVNTVPAYYADQVIKSAGFEDIGNPASENFGNVNSLEAQEQHTAMEAFAICCSWMEKKVLPDGYAKAPAEE